MPTPAIWNEVLWRKWNCFHSKEAFTVCVGIYCFMCFVLCKFGMFFPFSPLNFLKHTPALVGRRQSVVHGSANISLHHTTWALPGFLANCLWMPTQVSLLYTYCLLSLTFHVCAGLGPNYKIYIVTLLAWHLNLYLSGKKKKMSFGFCGWVVHQESMRTFSIMSQGQVEVMMGKYWAFLPRVGYRWHFCGSMVSWSLSRPGGRSV